MKDDQLPADSCDHAYARLASRRTENTFFGISTGTALATLSMLFLILTMVTAALWFSLNCGVPLDPQRSEEDREINETVAEDETEAEHGEWYEEQLLRAQAREELRREPEMPAEKRDHLLKIAKP